MQSSRHRSWTSRWPPFASLRPRPRPARVCPIQGRLGRGPLSRSLLSVYRILWACLPFSCKIGQDQAGSGSTRRRPAMTIAVVSPDPPRALCAGDAPAGDAPSRRGAQRSRLPWLSSSGKYTPCRGCAPLFHSRSRSIAGIPTTCPRRSSTTSTRSAATATPPLRRVRPGTGWPIVRAAWWAASRGSTIRSTRRAGTSPICGSGGSISWTTPRSPRRCWAPSRRGRARRDSARCTAPWASPTSIARGCL